MVKNKRERERLSNNNRNDGALYIQPLGGTYDKRTEKQAQDSMDDNDRSPKKLGYSPSKF